MKKLEKIIRRLNQHVDHRDYQAAFASAIELWEYPAYQKEIKNDRRRSTYVNALAKAHGVIAGMLQGYHSARGQFEIMEKLEGREYKVTVAEIEWIHKQLLERIYSVDLGHIVDSAGFSHKENAAYQLGILLKEARCHNSAIIWFQRCLSLARASGRRANIMGNLHQLAWNLETLARYPEARHYYDEMLEMLSDVQPSQRPLEWLVHAAMCHVRHGDRERGEEMMRRLISTKLEGFNPSDAQHETLPLWFYHALHSLGTHYTSTERFQEAIELTRMIMKSVDRFERPDWVRDATHGLIARIFVCMGQLDRALEELAEVFDIETTRVLKFDEGLNIEPWIDIARIHVANRHYEKAMAAYEILAYNLGAFLANRNVADTTRLRYYWLERMAFVVHEMVSVWLSISEMQTRQAVEAKVANALLQLKANLFVAMQIQKNFYRPTHNLFMANRRYAIAARKATDKPDDAEVMLELEDALWDREQIERSSVSTLFSLPGAPALFKYDFQQSQELGEDTLLLDFSLVNCQPPHRGLVGHSQGLRYIGIRLARDSLRLVDLGEAEQIERLCGPLIKVLSREPLIADDTSGSPQNQRHLRPADLYQLKDDVDLDRLTKRVYDRIVAPLEPLSSSLLFSLDGILAALPFHALIHEDRYLIEDREIAYCHSLLPKEALTIRGLSPSARALPPAIRTFLVLGDPSYTTNNLRSLPGTKLEVEEIAKLLKSVKLRSERHSVIDVQINTGDQATVSRLIGIDRPRYLHIAAHGSFDESQTRLLTGQPITFGGYYRRYEEMGASSINQLDNALLHSTLILADDPESVDDPANGALLTSLELASLNLYSCQVAVLSACDTGVGVTEYGAGVLGFQYALHASCALAGMVSLWKVLDQETSDFMIDFYRNFFPQKGGYPGYGAKAAYLAAIRKHCRRNGQRVHPYYWAAFLFLDQEYDHPFR
jgi:CHAT domain-containing protein